MIYKILEVSIDTSFFVKILLMIVYALVFVIHLNYLEIDIVVLLNM